MQNKNKFLNLLAEVEWGDIYNHENTSLAFKLFHSKLTKLYNEAFPKVKHKSIYYARKPWLTQALKKSINVKNRLYVIKCKHNTVYNEQQYKMYRNKVVKLLKIAEKKYYNDIFIKNKSNIRKTWLIIKEILNKSKSKEIKQNKFIASDGSLIDNQQTIAEKFNEFFVNVGPTLAKKIKKQDISPNSYLKNKMINSIFLNSVTDLEIINMLKSCKDSSPGYDDIKVSPLCTVLEYIAQPLSYICNLSLKEGIFPEELKIANVIPLFKKDNAMVFNNYRPVSLLCTLSKVFERIMYNRLINFLNENKILFEYQFGFRKNHSTQLALTFLMDKLINSIENGDHVIGVYLDFSKAFDTVDHNILLNKLNHYGIRGAALNWFQSYLLNRKQFVTYNGSKSCTKELKCGVPQGSILGPLLFLIYINDLAGICKHTMPIFFADDSNLFVNGTDLKVMESQLNDDLYSVSTWLKVNKLSLNIDKTQFMIFSRKKYKNYNVDLKIEGQSIDKVHHTKFLGIIIDDNLNWKNHVNYI